MFEVEAWIWLIVSFFVTAVITAPLRGWIELHARRGIFKYGVGSYLYHHMSSKPPASWWQYAVGYTGFLMLTVCIGAGFALGLNFIRSESTLNIRWAAALTAVTVPLSVMGAVYDPLSIPARDYEKLGDLWFGYAEQTISGIAAVVLGNLIVLTEVLMVCADSVLSVAQRISPRGVAKKLYYLLGE